MAFNAFCKVDGVDGECTDAAHDKWISLQDYKIGVTQSVSGFSATGFPAGGTADFDAFTITKVIDSSTPILSQMCAAGDPITKVEVELCLASGDKHTFMKYTMDNCIVSCIQSGSSAGGDETRPTEDVEFKYGKLTWEYTPIDDTGTLGAAVTRIYNVAQDVKE